MGPWPGASILDVQALAISIGARAAVRGGQKRRCRGEAGQVKKLATGVAGRRPAQTRKCFGGRDWGQRNGLGRQGAGDAIEKQQCSDDGKHGSMLHLTPPWMLNRSATLK